MISAFENLQIDRNLICEFFAMFARFEYALKEAGFCACKKNSGRAEPDWTGFRKKIGAALADCDDQIVVSAIRCLVNDPPQVQMCVHGHPEFQSVPLAGENDGEKAIEAAKRVRNNLFHGGKHTPHSPFGRDEKLIRCSLTILQASLQLDHQLRGEFEDQIA